MEQNKYEIKPCLTELIDVCHSLLNRYETESYF